MLVSFLRGVTDGGAVDMRPSYVAMKYVRTGWPVPGHGLLSNAVSHLQEIAVDLQGFLTQHEAFHRGCSQGTCCKAAWDPEAPRSPKPGAL